MAEDTEPTFTLRARDFYAPTLVRMWIVHARAGGVSDEKIESARLVMYEMLEYRAKHGTKKPD